jgi:polygalacturonase
VYFPPGRYVSGTIHVKSNVTINISPGATVAIGDDDDIDMIEELDYNPHADNETTYFNCALFRLDGVENVCIEGGGTIDGNRPRRHGPKPISVRRSTNVMVDGVWIENAFADGIDFDGCRFARVSNCRVNSGDDAICLKSSPALGEAVDCAHITVTNCHVATSANCFKLGTESGPGGFTDIAISNCTFDKQPLSRAPPGGIAIESVDGAVIDRVVASNITMNNVACPIFIRLGRRGRAQQTPTPGSLENVSISNVVATNADMPCIVSGGPGYRVKNVSLDTISVSYGPGAKGHVEKPVDPQAVPEAEDKYPDPRMFGELPCWAFYCRHAENVRVTNMQSMIESRLAKKKPAIVLDDVDRSNVKVDEYYL